MSDACAEAYKQRLIEAGEGGRSDGYQLTDDFDAAELILVIAIPDGDPALHEVRRDPVYQAHREKSIVFCEHDNPVTLVPGVYVGPNPRWASAGWAVPGPYFGKLRPSTLPSEGVDEPIKHLYSFVGSSYTHPIRQRLLGLQDDRALLRDTGDRATARYETFEAPEEVKQERQRSYDQALASSAFVLCPRGVCPAAVRFFETLRAGRVPVVISDDWLLPAGPSWDEFIIRVDEHDVHKIPELLREVEHEAIERGRLARETWEAYFSERAVLGRLIQWADSIRRGRRDSPIKRLWRLRMLLSHDHRWTALRSLVRRGYV